MSQIETLTERVVALEKQVQAMSHRLAQRDVRRDWLSVVDGSMVDFPEYEEVLRLGREARQSMTMDDEAEQQDRQG